MKKVINCYHCKKELIVHKFASRIKVCEECLEKGLYNPDKRSHSETKLKREQTNIKKFGYSYPAKSEQIKEKTKQTNLKNKGVEWAFLDKKTKNKIKETNLKRYGVENPSKSEEVKSKIHRKSILNRKENIRKKLKEMGLEILDEYALQDKPITFKCLKCLHVFKDTYFNVRQRKYPCPNCCPTFYQTSSYEQEISEFLTNLIPNEKIILNSRDIIPPKEIDIYIPSKKIGIELNGVYWHCDLFGECKFNHLNKLELCESKNIKLIQIFEDEWLYKKEIVKYKLKEILNNFEDNTFDSENIEIKIIKNGIEEYFEKYDINHGLVDYKQHKDTINIGIINKENSELILVMLFLPLGNDTWLLKKVCPNYNYDIGFYDYKILLDYFKNNFKWKSLHVEIDKRWSLESLYEELGFVFDRYTVLDWWYVKGNKRFLKEMEGCGKIWDCGNSKFYMINKLQ